MKDRHDIHTVSVAATQDEERRRARRTVVRRARSAFEARCLLEMLDLLPREGETR